MLQNLNKRGVDTEEKINKLREFTFEVENKLFELSSFNSIQAIEQIKLLSKIDSASSIILIHQRYLDLLSQKHMEVEESVPDKTKILEYNPKLQEVSNIKRKELKEHYQEIVGLKSELYIIDFENMNKYSLSKPKTIEAYLNLMPNITENERDLIEKS